MFINAAKLTDELTVKLSGARRRGRWQGHCRLSRPREGRCCCCLLVVLCHLASSLLCLPLFSPIPPTHNKQTRAT